MRTLTVPGVNNISYPNVCTERIRLAVGIIHSSRFVGKKCTTESEAREWQNLVLIEINT